ncbi:hypothetical protein WUBG_04996 [Wuchereria bancrofti]|uniref:Uncharacterized protein n=1 Tax=Wuchereria bancrofti TaxID=6293 RepID=J9ENM4_WUCBA|nr:hypothetical protein WUBG_04996 [Wuchereria bancrofti]
MNYVIIFIYFAMLLSDGVNLTTVSVNAIAFYCIVAYIKTCITTGIHAFLIAIFRIDEPFIARVTKVTYMWLAMSTLDSFTFIFSNRKLLRNRNVVNAKVVELYQLIHSPMVSTQIKLALPMHNTVSISDHWLSLNTISRMLI